MRLGALALRVECPEGGRLDDASVDCYIAPSLLRAPAARAELYNSLLREYDDDVMEMPLDDAKIQFIQVSRCHRPSPRSTLAANQTAFYL